MLDKLAQIESRYEELANELSSQELLSNPSAYAKAAKQHRSLGEIVEKYRSYKSLSEQLNGARELAAGSDDADMRELVVKVADENEMRTTDDQLPIPHRSSIYYVVNKLDDYDVLEARYGVKIAEEKPAVYLTG